MKLKLLKRDTDNSEFVPVDPEDNAAVSSFLLDSFFESVQIYLQDVRVTEDNSFRYLSSYIAKRLFFAQSSYDTFLRTECAAPDYGNDYDNTNPNINKGFQYRKMLFQKTPSGRAPVVHLLGN